MRLLQRLKKKAPQYEKVLYYKVVHSEVQVLPIELAEFRLLLMSVGNASQLTPWVEPVVRDGKTLLGYKAGVL